MTSSLLCLLLAATGAEGPEAGQHWVTVGVDGEERRYLLHVPAGHEEFEEWPVVLCFHGGAGNPEQIMRYCGLNETADRHGFLVVYPEGSGRIEKVLTWNAGNCCGFAQRRDVDDVRFVERLLDDLGERCSVDDKRIFTTGISNGAMISYRLASELSDRIAAIAPIAGPMGTETCTPEFPVSVIHLHGTEDEFAPFAGGRGARSISQTNFISVEQTIKAWVAANGCAESPVVEQLADTSDDGMTVRRERYAGDDGVDVELVVIEGGGHTWPGRGGRALRLLGPCTNDIAANEVMWEFFVRHPKR